MPTELRRDIHYSIYFNWFRFVSLGVVPFALLVLFNAKIYVALRKRKQRRLIRRAQQGKTVKVATYLQSGPCGRGLDFVDIQL